MKKISDNIQQNNKSIIRNFFIIGSGTILNLLIGLFTTPIITRLVDPTEYGQLSMFNTYSSIAMMIIGLGFDQSLMRYFYRHNELEYKRKLLSKCLFLPFIIILSLFPIVILSLYSRKINNIIIILFYINIIFLLLNRFATLIVRLNQKAKIYSLVTIFHKILYVGIAISLILFIKENHYIIITFATVISTVIVTFIAIFSDISIWKFWIKGNNYIITYSEMLRYGFPLMISSGIYLFFQAIDRLSLNYFCSYEEVGIYSSAMSLISLTSVVQTAFNTVWAPATIARYEENPNDKKFYQKGNRWITVCMFFIGISIILIKDIVVLFLGENYRSAAMIMPFLVFQPIMYTISETTVIGIYFKKKSYIQVIIFGITCIFNIISNIILIPIIGSKGAAISTGISYIIFFILRTLFSNRLYYINFDLKKIYVMIIATIIFALYNTFIKFNILTIIIYIIIIMILAILYKSTVKEIFIYGIKEIKSIYYFKK